MAPLRGAKIFVIGSPQYSAQLTQCKLDRFLSCRQTRRVLLSIFTLLLATAQASSPAPLIRSRWVDRAGAIEQAIPSLADSQWVWTEAQPGLPRGGPALTFLIAPPKKANQARLSGAISEDQSLQVSQAGTRLKVELYATLGSAELVFERPGAPPLHTVLIASAKKTAPHVMIHPGPCANRKFDLKPAVRDGKHLFIGFQCFEDFWNTYLYFVRSADSHWAYADFNSQAQDRSLTFQLEKESALTGKHAGPETTALFRVRTRDQAQRLTEYVVLE